MKFKSKNHRKAINNAYDLDILFQMYKNKVITEEEWHLAKAARFFAFEVFTYDVGKLINRGWIEYSDIPQPRERPTWYPKKALNFTEKGFNHRKKIFDLATSLY